MTYFEHDLLLCQIGDTIASHTRPLTMATRIALADDSRAKLPFGMCLQFISWDNIVCNKNIYTW